MTICVPVQAFVTYSWLRALILGESPDAIELQHDELADMEI
jgi:hypothetical protein